MILLRFSTPKGEFPVMARLASTPAELAAGFANRRDIGFDEAILFELPEIGLTPFTMAETYAPLDMLFLSGSLDGSPNDLQIVGMLTAPALSRTPYAARVPYRYVLETAAGRLAALGVDFQTRIQAIQQQDF